MGLNFGLFYLTFLIIPKKDWDLSTSDNFKPVEQNFHGVSQTPRHIVDHMGLYNHFGAEARFVSRSTDANLDYVDHVVLVREVAEDHDHEDGGGLGGASSSGPRQRGSARRTLRTVDGRVKVTWKTHI